MQQYRDTNLLPNALIGQAGLVARRDPAAALRVTAAAWSVRVRVGGDFPGLLPRADAACQGRRARPPSAPTPSGSGPRGPASGSTRRSRSRSGLPGRALPAPAGLSARELEVVRLVADGLANKAIAAQLHLSVRTVESHVRHVLAKAGLSNRTQLATWAREHIQ